MIETVVMWVMLWCPSSSIHSGCTALDNVPYQTQEACEVAGENMTFYDVIRRRDGDRDRYYSRNWTYGCIEVEVPVER